MGSEAGLGPKFKTMEKTGKDRAPHLSKSPPSQMENCWGQSRDETNFESSMISHLATGHTRPQGHNPLSLSPRGESE